MMLALDQNQNVPCDNFGTRVSQQTLAKHQKKTSVGTIKCFQRRNFSAKSLNRSNYHIAQKQGAYESKLAHTFEECNGEYTSFDALHKSKMRREDSFKTWGDSSPLLDDIDIDSIKEELPVCIS